MRRHEHPLGGQPATGDGADDARDAVRLLRDTRGRPPGLAREDHHRPLPVDADRLEPGDEPVRDVHAGEVERRDHDLVERDREVTVPGRARQVIAAHRGHGEVGRVVQGPLQEPLG